MMGEWGETLSRWGLHTANTQEYCRLSVYSELSELWEVPQAKSTLGVFLNSHSIYRVWTASQRNHSRGKPGGKWIFHPWAWAHVALSLQSAHGDFPEFMSTLRFFLLPAGPLTNVWTQNATVKVGEVEARGIKWGKKEEKKEDHTQSAYSGTYRGTQQGAIAGSQAFLWEPMQDPTSVWLQESVGGPGRSDPVFIQGMWEHSERMLDTISECSLVKHDFYWQLHEGSFLQCSRRHSKHIIACFHGI